MNQGNFKWDPDEAPHPPPLTQEEGHWIRQVQAEQAHGEQSLAEVGEAANRKLWLQFQSTASCMTKMYREGQQNPEALWQCFQLSAGALTQLYKDAMEEIATVKERAQRAGYLKCRADTATWAKTSRRRYLRREELLSAVALSVRNTHSNSSSADFEAVGPESRRFSPLREMGGVPASLLTSPASTDSSTAAAAHRPHPLSPPASLFPIEEAVEEVAAAVATPSHESDTAGSGTSQSNQPNRLKRGRERSAGNNSFNDELMDLFNINVKRPRRD